MSDDSSKPAFDASQIKILPWYEAIRRRPKWYVLETSAQGLSKAIADIAFDSLDPEKMNLSTETWITAHANFSYIFQDNGQGLPVQKRFGTTLENLHGGGPSYESEGFLSHLDRGSILNALSEIFSVETTLNGVHSFIAFSRGQVTSPYTESTQPNKKGTKIIFKPDKEIWEEVALEPQMLLESLQEAFKRFSEAIISLEQPQEANERFRIRVTLN